MSPVQDLSIALEECADAQALRAAELGDVEERLAKLEAIAKGRGWRGASDEQHPSAPGRGVNGHA
jgi:hypothetical protein